MKNREYVITEHFTTSQDIYVRAASKEEALQKVRDGETTVTEMGNITPTRPMTVRDIRVSHLDVTCEVCGKDALSGYVYTSWSRKQRGRCGEHVE